MYSISSKQGTRPFKKARTTNKSVRFATTCQVATFHQPSDYDNHKIWYNDTEYHSFKTHCKRDVIAYARALKQTGVFDSNEHCVRGLEGYFPTTRKQALEQRKRERLHAVLDQQDVQRVTGAEGTESLACLSGFYSKKSRDRAVQMARRDSLIWLQAS